jgi:hypothetical protein
MPVPRVCAGPLPTKVGGTESEVLRRAPGEMAKDRRKG